MTTLRQSTPAPAASGAMPHLADMTVTTFRQTRPATSPGGLAGLAAVAPTFGRAPVRAAALLALACASLVGGSFFVEYVLLVEPCPLCIIQRYTYATLAIVFLAAALAGPRVQLRRGLLFVALALVLIGGGVAAYQSKLQLFPAAQAATCSASLSYMMDTLPVTDVIARLFAAHGDCSDTSFKIAGLTLAQISLGVFTVLLFLVVPGLRRRTAK